MEAQYAFKDTEKTGIPLPLIRLQEGIFEGLSVEDSKTWTENFYKAFPDPDTDISWVVPKLMYWLMVEVQEFTDDKVSLKAIKTVEILYKRLIYGVNVRRLTWRKASAAAATAAVDAATAAGASADAEAVCGDACFAAFAGYVAAVTADADAAFAATTATATAVAAADGGQKFTKKTADKLIELLEELK